MFSRSPIAQVSTSGAAVSHSNVLATELLDTLRSGFESCAPPWFATLLCEKCHKEMLYRERALTGSDFGLFLSKTLSQRESVYCGVICRSRLEGQMRGLERGPGFVMKP